MWKKTEFCKGKMMQKVIVIAAWCGQVPCGGMGAGCRFPSEGGEAPIFFILLLSLRQLMAYNDIRIE